MEEEYNLSGIADILYQGICFWCWYSTFERLQPL
jgi:hypothetical protein